jgi:hypothetical protein
VQSGYHLPEQSGHTEETQREGQGAHVGDGQPIDRSVDEAQPEIGHDEKSGRAVILIGHMQDKHQRRERRKGFDRIQMARCARRPQSGTGRGVGST